MTSIRAIETRYAGCRFRSRLEARWAVFFDFLDISWQYEPQGYTLSNGRRYLPDFLLTDCGTWVEVKGHEGALDPDWLVAASTDLPEMPYLREQGPRLMILGPIPDVTLLEDDLGWIAICHDGSTTSAGFGSYHKNTRPWVLSGQGCSVLTGEILKSGDELGLTQPLIMLNEPIKAARLAYQAAREARFEHGERA